MLLGSIESAIPSTPVGTAVSSTAVSSTDLVPRKGQIDGFVDKPNGKSWQKQF